MKNKAGRLLLLMQLATFAASAQELYVFTEPASVMPARSLTVRSRTHMMGENAMYDRYNL